MKHFTQRAAGATITLAFCSLALLASEAHSQPPATHDVVVYHDSSGAVIAARTDWKGIRELRLGPQETLRLREVTKPLVAAWQGTAPEFRNLHWIEKID